MPRPRADTDRRAGYEPAAAGFAHEVLQQAHRRAVCATPAERAAAVVKVLGSRIASASLGVDNTRNLLRWSRGGPIRDADIEHKLQVLHHLVTALGLAHGDEVAVAFMRACHPDLDNEAPMHVLANNRPTRAEPLLLAALEGLLITSAGR